MTEYDDTPEWVSPPFPYVFLTAVKWVVSVAIILTILAVVGLLIFFVAGAGWVLLDR